MTKAFRCIALAVGICALQAQSIQADIEELGRIGLYPTKLWGSAPGTEVLNDSGLSGVLLGATGTYADRPKQKSHHQGPTRGRPSKWAVKDSSQVDSVSAGPGQRIILKVVGGTAMTLVGSLLGGNIYTKILC